MEYKVTNGQYKLLEIIKASIRLPNQAEVFEIYTEHVMTNEASCKYNPYVQKGASDSYIDYELCELEVKAVQWYKMSLGSLIKKEILVLDYMKEINLV